MKKLNKHIIWLLMAILTLHACEEESNLQSEGNWELSAPSALPLNEDNKLELDQSNPHGKVVFNWEAAVSSARYGVYYTVVIDSLEAKDESHPIITFQALEGGKSTSATITNLELNDALYMAGFNPDEELALQWRVEASCLSKTSADNDEMTIIRYDDDKLFLSGAATEVGNNTSKAIQLMRLKNNAGEKLKLYEVYTKLTANDGFMIYNGRSDNAIAYGLDTDGNIVRDGQPITVDEEGIYRINIDFEAMSISFYKLNALSLIGAPFENGWDADEDLEYQGLGVWQSDISFVKSGNFIIRANNGWEGIIKHKAGTANEAIGEDFANNNDIAIDDFQQDEAGFYTVTLTLTGEEYTLKLEKAPEQRLYMFVNGTDSYELSMVGDGVFTTTAYMALQSSDQISINTEADGSGINYSVAEINGEGSGDKVEGTVELSEGEAAFNTNTDQAYGFTIDVNAGELKWHYYNMKLFHWDDDADGGWDERYEIEMTYVHPYTFSASAELFATHESKFNSPWDVSFGADDETAMSGTMTNQGGSNFKNIATDGNYAVTITVAPDYSTGTYEFVSQ
ncbi:SusE domain-containing protein [Carboxylicivirga sp. A043]|uniref:SusE domain-containing protein n=1 Tax=Carboxylicivirga litoralis TaxID=2816963 RepID=UPI0021CB3043|nr:SusE domain-containing protein [Carboxylicivirga sp. A043]MCU4155543.1 SusE domain-containing protein [Carboxylicivirga sp. A043]